MTRLALREGPLVEFEANGHKYNYGYFLADGIYPRCQIFVKPVIQPRGKKQTQFHNAQAAAKKDVERAFGILQAQFAIMRGLARFWDQECLWQWRSYKQNYGWASLKKTHTFCYQSNHFVSHLSLLFFVSLVTDQQYIHTIVLHHRISLSKDATKRS
jgi:hypothetical protein